ncbi:response regulator transcription factor [Terribacillus saccharophilus]|uniref:response regulator transcription factor n=1 Tax=Terribacillus saccharophilus TaxID=361277 RepID=UPI0037FC096B
MDDMMENIKVLVVDDEQTITQFLMLGLQNEGYIVENAADGMQAIAKADHFEPHIVILDVMMPGTDGFEVCRMLKKKGRKLSIIMLTARDQVDDRIKGLNGGADDYLVKPFSFEELLARMQARLRNQFPELGDSLVAGPLRIDDRRKEVYLEEELLQLSPTEYELLKYLAMNQGIVLSKALILDKVWGYAFGGEENIVEVYIRSLREKLHDKDRQLIRTIRGAGYRLDVR